MDPAMLYAPPERIRQEVADILSRYGTGPGHIFNLGHGISRNTDPAMVDLLVDVVHEA